MTRTDPHREGRKLLSNRELIEELRNTTGKASYAEDNPHWWCGRSAAGTYWWEYKDEAESEWEGDEYLKFKTLDDLKEQLCDPDWMDNDQPRWLKTL